MSLQRGVALGVVQHVPYKRAGLAEVLVLGVQVVGAAADLAALEHPCGHARGSRSVSALPDSPATVEKPANTGVRLPTFDRNAAFVHCVTSAMTSKNLVRRCPWRARRALEAARG